MKVLILSGRFGMGHDSAAKAIEEELLRIDGEMDVKRLDLLAYIYPSTHQLIYRGFNRLVDRHHEIYNMIYKASDKLEMDMKLSGNSNKRKMKNLIEGYRPDLIISTLPICARTIGAYKEASGLATPLVTCITDISLHSEWITDRTDIYFVPTRETKDKLIEAGVLEEKIYVVGIPVRQEFKNIERKKTGEKNILIMGGGLGLLPDLGEIIESLESVENLKLTIITGKNKKAYDRLEGRYDNIELVGFTNRVSDYMSQADFMISKAGGITLFESIYSETPMFVIQPFLAQEIDNARFIDENLIGQVVWTKEEGLSATLLDLIRNEIKIRAMKKNMRDLRKRIVEDDVYEVLREICRECVA